MRRGFSLIELLIVVAIILIIITVAVPGYNKAQMFTREMAAAKAVQTIQTGEIMYSSRYGRYAQSLLELGPPADSGPSGAGAAGLISGTLASGVAGSYKFSLAATPETFAITANPAVCGSSAVASFFMDQSGSLRTTDCPAPATAASREFAK